MYVDKSYEREFSVELDKGERKIKFSSRARAIGLELTLSKKQFKKSRREEWIAFGRKVFDEHFERAISCRDGSLGPITARGTGAQADQATAAAALPAPAPSAAPAAAPQGDTPPSQDDIADIIARLKKSQSDDGKD